MYNDPYAPTRPISEDERARQQNPWQPLPPVPPYRPPDDEQIVTGVPNRTATVQQASGGNSSGGGINWGSIITALIGLL